MTKHNAIMAALQLIKLLSYQCTNACTVIDRPKKINASCSEEHTSDKATIVIVNQHKSSNNSETLIIHSLFQHYINHILHGKVTNEEQ